MTKRLEGCTLDTYTSALSTQCFSGAFVPSYGAVTQLPPLENGRLFSGLASGLDAFSLYRLRRGCPALPCRTTGTLEAAAFRSSRTKNTLPSGDQQS